MNAPKYLCWLPLRKGESFRRAFSTQIPTTSQQLVDVLTTYQSATIHSVTSITSQAWYVFPHSKLKGDADIEINKKKLLHELHKPQNPP